LTGCGQTQSQNAGQSGQYQTPCVKLHVFLLRLMWGWMTAVRISNKS
jgi:hypothetical protein